MNETVDGRVVDSGSTRTRASTRSREYERCQKCKESISDYETVLRNSIEYEGHTGVAPLWLSLVVVLLRLKRGVRRRGEGCRTGGREGRTVFDPFAVVLRRRSRNPAMEVRR